MWYLNKEKMIYLTTIVGEQDFAKSLTVENTGIENPSVRVRESALNKDMREVKNFFLQSSSSRRRNQTVCFGHGEFNEL